MPDDRLPFRHDDPPIPDRLHGVMNTIGRQIQSALNDATQGQPRVGFVLLTFDFGEGGTMSYLSNAEREDVLRAMNEFITRNSQ